VPFYVDVINVFNRKNTGSYGTSLEYDPISDKTKIKQEAGGSLPFLPSFGCRSVAGLTWRERSRRQTRPTAP
jgi:hypothetical protein